MKFNHTVLFIAVSGLGFSANTNAALSKNIYLPVEPAFIGACVGDLGTPPDMCTYGTVITSGSYFGMGSFGNVPMTPGLDGGIFVGQTQTSSGAHGGAPTGNEATTIDAAWFFFCNTGFHYTTVPITVINNDVNSDGGFTQTVDFSGWTVGWSGIPEINLAGVGTVVCSAAGCPPGSTYTLDFATLIPSSPLHNFGNVPYSLHLEGTVTEIPPFDVTADSVMPAFDGSPLIIDVLANDDRITTYSFAPAIDTSTVQVVSNPSFGTAVANIDGTITYNRSALDYASVDSFTYTVSDDAGFISSLTTVTVAGTNPVISSQMGVTESDVEFIFDIAGSAMDNTGIVAASTLVGTSPLHGSIINAGDGTLSYTPNAGFTGIDTFTVTIEDDTSDLSRATIQSITVNANKPGSNSGDFVPGAAANAAGNLTGGGLTVDEVGTDPDMLLQCVGGCVDFIINSLTAGDTVNVVVPLSAAIPANATYRKLIAGTWVSFTSDADNALASAAAITSTPLLCPEAGNAVYVSGLTEGNECLQITMKEGGVNDADGVANGSLMDPGGIGEMAASTPPATAKSSGSSGCSISDKPASLEQHADWWIVAGFLAFLGLLRRKLVN